jgi:PAS domain S-box-containing protein
VDAVSVSRLDEPAVGAVVSNVRDRTEYEVAREAMRESEAQYRAVFDGALDAMIVTDDQGRFLEANPAACELWGLSRQELLQRNITEFAEPGFRIEQVLEAIAKSGRFSTTHPIFRPDGTVREVEASTTGGILPGRHFTSLRDLTARKRMEDQLRMGQKMEAVGRLAGGVAHDFNNLLAVITGYGDMLHRELGPQDPRLQRVEQVRKAADRAASLVRQLLAFSRRQVLQPRVLSLADVVEELAPMLGRLIGEDVELVTRRAADLAQVKADAGQVEQVIMNLVVNARDAVVGAGRITLETGAVHLDADAARDHDTTPGERVFFAITDTGSGMSEQVAARAFEPFFTTKPVGKGTGLGLAMCEGIVRQAGGHITLDSEPGRGSTLRVFLPRADDEPSEPIARAPTGSPARGRETLLLVEDEPLILRMAKRVLSELGYTVLTASGGLEALEVLGRHAGDVQLLITDVVMPKMSGRELAARVTALRPDIRVLYSSGYAADAIGEDGVIGDGINFLAKPYEPSRLADAVRDVLDK